MQDASITPTEEPLCNFANVQQARYGLVAAQDAMMFTRGVDFGPGLNELGKHLITRLLRTCS